jgi:hypothetical protein
VTRGQDSVSIVGIASLYVYNPIGVLVVLLSLLPIGESCRTLKLATQLNPLRELRILAALHQCFLHAVIA